ncbi:MAG: DUF456 domain-containing protein [Candidatus Atribacteria bacterium]|nr:DUF456 domain-containing protein [Candidatus Atribacteria bacterium]
MFIFIGIILNLLGIIGILFPVLPGIILNYIPIILLYINRGEEQIDFATLLVFGVLSISAVLLDYILPILEVKKFGASRKGLWCSIIGMIIGILFFPPFGMFFGLFLGSIIGELWSGKESSQAFKAGLATFLGSFTSLVFKLILAITMAIYFLFHLS